MKEVELVDRGAGKYHWRIYTGRQGEKNRCQRGL